MMTRFKKLLTIIFVLFLASQLAGQAIYEDETYSSWKNMAFEGNISGLIQSVETNLASGDPHPLAGTVWVRAHQSAGDLDEALKTSDPAFRDRVQFIADVLHMGDNGQYIELYEKYPLQTAMKWIDINSSYFYTNSLEEIDYQAAAELNMYCFTKFGENFRLVWNFEFLGNENKQVRDLVISYIGEGKFDNFPAAKKYLSTQLGQPNRNNSFDKFFALREYLKTYPDDPYALRYFGHQQSSKKDFSGAALGYGRAFQIDPFYSRGLNQYSHAVQLVKMGKLEEGEQAVDLLLKSMYNSEAASQYFAEWTGVLYDAGEKGLAREVIEKGYEQFPEDPAVNLKYGELEYNSKRYGKAIGYLNTAFKNGPKHYDYYRILLSTYKSNDDPGKALDLLDHYESNHKYLHSMFYFEKRGVLLTAKEYQDAVDLSEEAVRLYKYNPWRWKNLAYAYSQNGQKDKAREALFKSFEIMDPDNWASYRIYDYVKATNDNNEEPALKMLYEMAVENPTNEYLWNVLYVKRGDAAEKLKILEEAKATTPEFFWPYKMMNQRLVEQRLWAEAFGILDEAEPLIQAKGSHYERKELQYWYSETYRQKASKSGIDQEEFGNAMERTERFLEEGGVKDDFWYRDVANFLNSVGKRQEAAQYLDSGLLYNPHAPHILTLIQSAFQDVYGTGKLARRFWESLQKDPYTYDRYRWAIHFHSKWGGSPIVAIVLAQTVKERFPDDYPRIRNEEVMSYGNLGDNIKDFELRYAREDVISNSERYINWYHTSRRGVRSGSTRVEIDPDEYKATIYFPDGTIAERADDPVSGSVSLLQIGDAYIRAAYSKTGNLTKLESSQGKNVEFTYNEKELITKVSSSSGGDLSFQYNPQGKPVLIEVNGIGRVESTYDPTGLELIESVAYDNDGNEAGFSITSRINSVMQEMFSLSRTLRNAGSVSSARLPDLGIKDEKFEAFLSRYYDIQDQIESKAKQDLKLITKKLQTALETAAYLKDNTRIDATYGPEAADFLLEAWYTVRDNYDKKTRQYAVESISHFHEVMLKIRKNGVAIDYWNEWIGMQEWLQKEKLKEVKLTDYRTSIEKLQDRIRERPIELLATSQWLPKSFLQTNGYWKRYELSQVIPSKYRDGLELNTLLWRSKGDIVLGTNKGLAVLRKGFWEHLAFDALKREWQRDLSPDRIKATSNINTLTEDDEGRLYVGTNDGIMVIEGDYLGKPARRITDVDGLPSNVVGDLVWVGGRLLIATSQGLVSWDGDRISSVEVNGNINFISSMLPSLDFGMLEDDDLLDYDYIDEEETVESYPVMEKVVVGTDQAVFELSTEPGPVQLKEILSESRDHAVLTGDGEYYFQSGDVITTLVKDGERMHEVELLGNIITTESKQVYGLGAVPVSEGSPTLAVATDLGLSLYHQKHFEHFYLPLTPDRKVDVRKISSNANSFATYGNDAVYVFSPDLSTVVAEGVNDILTIDSLGITFIASQNSLQYILNDDPSNERRFLEYYANSSVLTKDNQDRLIANNGLQILRYTFDPGSQEFSAEELLYATQYEAGNFYSGDVKDIKVTSDGTVWVVTSLSVFRYTEQDGKGSVQEFNYFRSPEKFPSRTHMMYRIHELPDGRIWAIASDEGHLSHKGIELDGGILEWDADKEVFELLDVEGNYKQRGFNWFITSLTNISDGKAIAGTTGGFALYENGEIKDYWDGGGGRNNPSYNRLMESYPALYLGTRGASLGDLWLFGCASGVVAYQNGIWFYPDRLNQMLPSDLEYGAYGGRHVNAISTDAGGKVYVGTDLGLLIYDTGGGDPISFLVNNGMIEEAFQQFNLDIINRERDVIIDDINKDTEAGKIVAGIKALDREIEDLRTLKAKAQESVIKMSVSRVSMKVNEDSLTALIEDREKRYIDLLLRLENEAPAIHQLLDIKPVDLAALRKNLGDDECMVQYIPTERKLFIQVLAKDRIEIREVIVQRDSIMKAAKFVSNGIYHRMDLAILEDQLSFLYEILIRPIHSEIENYANVMVVPVQSLYYLPFNALVDRKAPGKQAYLAESRNVGYISSTYLLNLLLKTRVSSKERYLLMGDPDGSLPGAREEVSRIGDLLEDKQVFVDRNVTVNNLRDHSGASKVVHLATHGYLDKESPNRSSILMANEKLTLPQIFGLPMDDTEMIVLSACETGKGADKGLEYATIARAFANAGAGTIVATLWKVNDEATQELMVEFYSELLDGKGKLEALSAAQRKLIGNEKFDHPYYWASFILMGRP